MFQGPAQSLGSCVSPKSNKHYASCHLRTFFAPEAPSELYLSTTVFSLACSGSVHSRSMRCAFCFGIWTNEIPYISFASNHLLIIQSFLLYIIWCNASSWASSSSVQIAYIHLYSTECSVSATWFSSTVLCYGSSGRSEKSHIVW